MEDAPRGRLPRHSRSSRHVADRGGRTDGRGGRAARHDSDRDGDERHPRALDRALELGRRTFVRLARLRLVDGSCPCAVRRLRTPLPRQGVAAGGGRDGDRAAGLGDGRDHAGGADGGDERRFVARATRTRRIRSAPEASRRTRHRRGRRGRRTPARVSCRRRPAAAGADWPGHGGRHRGRARHANATQRGLSRACRRRGGADSPARARGFVGSAPRVGPAARFGRRAEAVGRGRGLARRGAAPRERILRGTRGGRPVRAEDAGREHARADAPAGRGAGGVRKGGRRARRARACERVPSGRFHCRVDRRRAGRPSRCGDRRYRRPAPDAARAADDSRRAGDDADLDPGGTRPVPRPRARSQRDDARRLRHRRGRHRRRGNHLHGSHSPETGRERGPGGRGAPSGAGGRR